MNTPDDSRKFSIIQYNYSLSIDYSLHENPAGEQITRPCGSTLFTKEGKVRTRLPLPPLVKGVPSADGGGFAPQQ